MLNQELNGSIFREKGIGLLIKREDLLFPEIQGNKWRKLKYNLDFARAEGYKQLLSFGGAYSNHIAALAAAGKKFGFETVGIIRGERPKDLNPTLSKAEMDGMILSFVDRITYRLYTQGKSWKSLSKDYPEAYIIPEGGTNLLAIKGCQEILTAKDKSNFDIIACPVGTAGTVSGIISSLKGEKEILAFSALKGDFLKGDIDRLLGSIDFSYSNYTVVGDYHFGGYAKHTPELITFIHEFYAEYGIPLDPIYTGKMMFGIMDMIRQDKFERGTRILVIHTGGLQGIAGFNERYGTLLKSS